MSRSTGPILAAGALTFVSRSVLGDEPDDLRLGARVLVGTGIVAMTLSAFERVSEPGAVAFAWLALTAALFVPPPGAKSPIQTALTWWESTTQ